MIEDEAVTASQQVGNIGLEIRCDLNEHDYEEIHSFQVCFTLYVTPVYKITNKFCTLRFQSISL